MPLESCGWRECRSGSRRQLVLLGTTALSIVCRSRMSAAVVICTLLGIEQYLSLNFGCNAARAIHPPPHSTEKRGVLLMMLKSQTGLTSTVTSVQYYTLRQKLRWKPSYRFKITHPPIVSLYKYCNHTSITIPITGLIHHTPFTSENAFCCSRTAS